MFIVIVIDSRGVPAYGRPLLALERPKAPLTLGHFGLRFLGPWLRLPAVPMMVGVKTLGDYRYEEEEAM